MFYKAVFTAAIALAVTAGYADVGNTLNTKTKTGRPDALTRGIGDYSNAAANVETKSEQQGPKAKTGRPDEPTRGIGGVNVTANSDQKEWPTANPATKPGRPDKPTRGIGQVQEN